WEPFPHFLAVGMARRKCSSIRISYLDKATVVAPPINAKRTALANVELARISFSLNTCYLFSCYFN
ncbi:hypothetical protein, partial [Shewanella xiamenensis]|uniref:hypothetical protein n=1 Tax=Shewanella xiamenensis TaxID=332186 RepID=UPI00313E5A2E